jgi:large subunit ribosomal protein L19
MIHESILPKIKAGATVRVFETVKDGDKTRESRFEGVIIARKHGSEAGASFTVRATLAGEGVEKTIPLHSPLISKVEIISTPKKVHRSKMYFVREISRKSLRRKTAVTADKVAKVEKSAKAAKTEETK